MINMVIGVGGGGSITVLKGHHHKKSIKTIFATSGLPLVCDPDKSIWKSAL